MNISTITQSNISDYSNYQINMENNSEAVKNEQTDIGFENDTNSNEEFTKNELDKNLVKLNKFLEDDKVHAEYSVHDTFSTIMIKIVDDKTKKVILEIPPKKILDMIASMCKQFGIFDKKA